MRTTCEGKRNGEGRWLDSCLLVASLIHPYEKISPLISCSLLLLLKLNPVITLSPIFLVVQVKMHSRAVNGCWFLATQQSAYCRRMIHTLSYPHALSLHDSTSSCPVPLHTRGDWGSSSPPKLPLLEDPTLAIQPHLWPTDSEGLEMDRRPRIAIPAEIQGACGFRLYLLVKQSFHYSKVTRSVLISLP